jgi:hypothetical protein
VTQDATLDELDTRVQEASILFQSSASWEDFVPKVRDARGDFHPDVGKVPHPAAHLLSHFRISGDPVTCSGVPWTFVQKAAALTRGPHQSARQYLPFLRQEFIDMIRKGQWTLLPDHLVFHEPQLCLSPLGVVPQRGHRPQTISDFSFFGVSHETVSVSPEECMHFGRAFWRILRHLKYDNPHLGPVYVSKIEMSDGFYRIWVRASDFPKLGVLFPSADGDEYLVGFPLVPSMGWTEDPKVFTAATEMVADVANSALSSGSTFRPHQLESTSDIRPAPSAPVTREVSLPVTAASPAPHGAAPTLFAMAFSTQGALPLWPTFGNVGCVC